MGLRGSVHSVLRCLKIVSLALQDALQEFDLPDLAAVETGLTTGALRTIALLVIRPTTAEAGTVAAATTSTGGAVTLLMTSLATAKAGPVAATAAVVVVAGSVCSRETASRAPAVIGSSRSAAEGVTTRAELVVGVSKLVGAAELVATTKACSVAAESTSWILGLLQLFALFGFSCTVLLGVLVLDPILGGDLAVAELAKGDTSNMLLGLGVRVGWHVGIQVSRTTGHYEDCGGCERGELDTVR